MAVKIGRKSPGVIQLIVEYGFAFAIIALVIRAAWLGLHYGQLPQPFFYDVSDTFMDWFNPALYAHDVGTYDPNAFGSIYPPLSFVVMKLFSKSSCYAYPMGLAVRECDWIGLATLWGMFLIDGILMSMVMAKIDKRTAFPRAVALSLGMPILFGLERGNIILMCLACLVLAFGPLLRSARLRWFFAALAVNFKVYLIGGVFALLLRRRWLWFEGTMAMTILVYIVTYGIMQGGSPFEVFHNIIGYTQVFTSASQVLDVWYSDTYQPMASLLTVQAFPLTAMLGSRIVDTISIAVPLLTRTGQLGVIVAALATWLRPEAVPPQRVVFLGIILALISSESSGYTEVIAIYFVFMEKWDGFWKILAIISCYLLSVPGDYVFSEVLPLVKYSYIASRDVEVRFGIALGMFVRPGLFLIVAMAMSGATISDVWNDIRKDGWSQRWRFRRDWPLLPRVRKPVGPLL